MKKYKKAMLGLQFYRCSLHLKELYTKYHDKGIEFIGISDDDSKSEA